MAQKEFAIKMEKVLDLPKGEAEKYDILAYFKEQEAIKTKVENAMIEQIQTVSALSQETPNRAVISNIAATPQAPTQVSVTCPHPNKSFLIWDHYFTVTDLLLCFIAFFLFVLLIIHD